ncbi:MAG: sensor histidine kinase [Campylobacterales bacterium]|nr:sensor histidine kinase [Campylobacterales bacterium]
MKYFFLILLVYINLFAKTPQGIILSDLEFMQDTEHIYTPQEILKSNLTKATKTQIGAIKGPFWTKLTISNTTDFDKTLAFYNPIAGMNAIDVFIYEDGKLIQKHVLGDLREQKIKDVLFFHSVFMLHIAPKQTFTIISKLENYGLYNIGWEILTLKEYHNFDFTLTLTYAFLGGFLFFYIFYVLYLYKIHRKIGYLILIVQSLSILLYIYAAYGVFYRLDIGLSLHFITTVAWTISGITMMTMASFAYVFFGVSKKYPKIKWMLITLFGFFGLIFFLGIFIALGTNPDFSTWFSYFPAMMVLNYILLFCVAIYMYFKKEIGWYYYLFGQGTLLSFIVIYMMAVFGIIDVSRYITLIIPLALVVDSTFMLFSQYLQAQVEKKTMMEQKELLLEQSRFYSIGLALGSIVHQWKHPLTQLGTTITMLDTIYREKPKELDRYTSDAMPSIKYSIEQMQFVLDEFSTMYHTSKNPEPFYPLKSVEQIATILLKSKIILKNVTISYKIPKDIKINGYDYLFNNVMTILIDNSLDAFDPSCKDNKIDIKIKQIKNHKITIHYQDNAGGIEPSLIHEVFEYGASTKEGKSLKGYGLAIAKMIIVERMLGEIEVQNIDNGVLFVIKFPSTL